MALTIYHMYTTSQTSPYEYAYMHTCNTPISFSMKTCVREFATYLCGEFGLFRLYFWVVLVCVGCWKMHAEVAGFSAGEIDLGIWRSITCRSIQTGRDRSRIRSIRDPSGWEWKDRSKEVRIDPKKKIDPGVEWSILESIFYLAGYGTDLSKVVRIDLGKRIDLWMVRSILWSIILIAEGWTLGDRSFYVGRSITLEDRSWVYHDRSGEIDLVIVFTAVLAWQNRFLVSIGGGGDFRRKGGDPRVRRLVFARNSQGIIVSTSSTPWGKCIREYFALSMDFLVKP